MAERVERVGAPFLEKAGDVVSMFASVPGHAMRYRDMRPGTRTCDS